MRIRAKLFRWAMRLTVLIAVYLLAIALMPGFPRLRRHLSPNRKLRVQPTPEADENVEAVRFAIDRDLICGRFYLPDDTSFPVPCIIMAHGLGGTMSMGLDAYAQRLRTEGFAVLAFDYRTFGLSQGQPRQLVWIPDQLADWRRAIRYARSRPEIDAARIALWGTSLSGGHVIANASEDHDIACVVAQCPGLDGRKSAEATVRRIGWKGAVELIIHAQRDLVRAWLRLSAHKIPIVAPDGELAFMASDNAWEAFNQLAPHGFVNEACARIAIRGDRYRPVKKTQYVRCPVLLQICEYDELTPLSAADETARRLGELAVMKRYPIGHFDIYFGEWFEKALNDQLDFLHRNLDRRDE